MIVRKANNKDLNNIDEIYFIAIKHMVAEGNVNQWSDHQGFVAGVKKYITEDCFYVVEDNEEIVGFFALIYGIDKTYNEIRKGEWLNDDEYVTIHKIAVKYHKKNIASFIINFVIDLISNQNIKIIRIDTHEKNKSMKSFLQKNGFKYCGEISIVCDFSDLDSLRDAYLKQV